MVMRYREKKKDQETIIISRFLVFCIHMVFFSFLFSNTVLAGNSIEINETNFPDIQFRSYIKENCDINGNGILEEEEISAVEQIYCESAEIVSIKGIGYFKELRYLFFANNGISTVDLSSNVKLEYIDFRNNKITKIDLKGLYYLQYFLIANNQLTELDLRDNVKLEEVSCEFNNLTELVLPKNDKMNYLSCQNNKIDKLNISGVINILNAYNSGCKRVLDSGICIYDIGEGSNSSYLCCDGDLIFETDEFISIDDNNFPDEIFRDLIKGFDVDQNGFLDTKEISEIKIINCDNLGIESLSGIEFLWNLGILNCHYNKLTRLDLCPNKLLFNLCCSYNDLSELILDNPFLDDLQCGSNKLRELDLSKEKNVSRLVCGNNELTELDVHDLKRLYGVGCENNHLGELDLSHNKELEYLSCGNNELSYLNLENLELLRHLYVRHNKSLIEIDLNKNINLEVLECAYCKNLNFINLRKNEKLYLLDCRGTSANELDISGCPNLINIVVNGKKSVSGNDIMYELNEGHVYVGKNTIIKVNDYSMPHIFILQTNTVDDLTYNSQDGYNHESFNLEMSAVCALGYNDEIPPACENVKIEIQLPEGLSFEKDQTVRTFTKNLGTMSLEENDREDISLVVYIDGSVVTEKFEIKADLTADGYETPRSQTFEIPVTRFVKNVVYYVEHEKIKVEFDDYESYFSGSSLVYNPETARFLIALAQSAYHDEDLPFALLTETEQGQFPNKPLAITESLKNLGFSAENIREYNYCHDESDYGSDTAGYSIATKKMRDGTDMILIVVRGSTGKIVADFWTQTFSMSSDWWSNISFENFYKGYHEGFSKAALGLYKNLDQFKKDHAIDEKNVKYVITGHSRGAAISNIVSKFLVDSGVPKNRVFSYNFACPDTARDFEENWNPSGKYDCIFNINNVKDIVGVVPGALFSQAYHCINQLTTLFNNNTRMFWGKYGNTYFFSKDWNDTYETMLLFWEVSEQHDATKAYIPQMDRRQTLRDFRSWEEARASLIINEVNDFCVVIRSINPLSEDRNKSDDEITMDLSRMIGFEIVDETGTKIMEVIDGELKCYEEYEGDIIAFVSEEEIKIILSQEIKFYLKFTGDGVNGIEYYAGSMNKTDDEIAYANVNLAVGENAVSIIDDNFDDPVKLVLLNAEHDPIAQFDVNGQLIEIDEETQEEYSELPFVFPHVQRFGDCNGDGEVNRADRIYLARAIAGWDGYVLPPAEVADFNRDGEVNRADRIYLARAIAGWDGYDL